MTLYTGLDILDGETRIDDATLVIEGGIVQELRPREDRDTGEDLSRADQRAIICPGFIDLQVNGGAGLMLGDCRSTGDISALAAAHTAGGTLAMLPTLISDTPETTARIIDLVSDAAAQDPRILGLHLEGPHLTVAGAHDPDMLRKMTDDDMALYQAAAERLPHLMITLAPEQVSPAQLKALAEAGVIVSLGHTDCDYDTAHVAILTGARAVTHLFNAMSGLNHRAPGLVGAALEAAPFFGFIADGHHVHPAAARIAYTVKPEALYLTSDAMAVAGTDAQSFTLAGHEITRADGRLARADGTLAGADVTMLQAVKNLVTMAGCTPQDALRAAFDAPHRLLKGGPARIVPGAPARLLQLHGARLTARMEGAGGWI